MEPVRFTKGNPQDISAAPVPVTDMERFAVQIIDIGQTIRLDTLHGLDGVFRTKWIGHQPKPMLLIVIRIRFTM